MAIGQYNHADNGQVNGLEDLEQPFIRREKDVGYGNNKPDKRVESGSIGMVLLSTFVAVSGSFEFGSCVGYSAPTQSAIREDLKLSLAEYSMFGSILTIGAMLGAVTSGRIADFIGRKGAMRMSAGFCIAGWLAVYFSRGAFPLDMGRLFTGYGIGVFSYVVPIFIAEIAPKNLRGGLTTLNQLMIVIGSSVAFLMGTVITWRTLALTGLVPCIFLLVGLCFVPESPRWLAKVGHEKEFQVALQRLRGKDADITCEASEILDNIETLQTLQKVKLMDLFQSKHIRSVTIGTALMIFQQFGGINGISFYASETFASAGLSSTKIGTIAYACVQVPITVVGAILMDKSGRRPLIMISATGTFLGCFLAGTSFVLKSHSIWPEWVAILAVGGVLIYIASFSIGLGAVPWVIMSEIFPIHVKGAAGSLVVLVNWLGAWAVSYTFNFLMSWSASGTFFIYSAFSVMTVLFVAKLVPETKGKTLEEIQASINS
ncbi:sugar transporter ERD6-like 16 isoform X3 [Juglans microcarpa x Juglans regia]|uniref:sugar transporter ERD6-like 16 isoform X3 n=1 Tax=Juglans microcarpa x Juglans regia TaxID=2249226 RepID=UPI001B7E7EA8|nr:sugar transporter ERD6-like 16 isoform X3 [Juglans microcarpa x Juglans regia]